jgi:hypothetical protein
MGVREREYVSWDMSTRGWDSEVREGEDVRMGSVRYVKLREAATAQL